MIIIGYPGIGKSTLGGRYHTYIDLESSNFNDKDGSKPENWHIAYCKLAEDLSRQGYRVFVSCHKEVQEYLKNSEENVVICYPCGMLKDKWVSRLKFRYDVDPSEKNQRALDSALKWYDIHIKAIEESDFKNKLALTSIDYTLDNEIDNFIYKHYEKSSF